MRSLTELCSASHSAERASACALSCSTTNAFGLMRPSASGWPTTAASKTEGWAISPSSTSKGDTPMPPRAGSAGGDVLRPVRQEDVQHLGRTDTVEDVAAGLLTPALPDMLGQRF